MNSHSSFLLNTQADIMFIDKEYRGGLIILIKNRRKDMRVKIKAGDNKVEFNMSKSQALLIVKMAQEFEKMYMTDVYASLGDVDSETGEDSEK